jgi:hemin uptake protein HemP
MKSLQTTQRFVIKTPPAGCDRSAHIVNDTVDSKELLGTDGIVLISHESMKYQLRVTRQGKLILTK